MPNLQNSYFKVNRLNRSGKGQVLDKNNKSLFEIPFSLPHEIISTNDIYGQVNSRNLIEASPFRVKPPCPQFTKCGGCSLQHASKSFVTDWKESIVARALEEKKLFTQFRSTVVAPDRSRRRAVFSGRRTKKGTIVGFKASRSDKIVSIIGCKILDERIIAFLPGMKKITALVCTRSSTIKIHVSCSENGLDVLIKAQPLLDVGLRVNLTRIAIEYDLARLSWDSELVALIKPPIQTIGKVKIIPPAEFFVQATKEAEIVMVNDVCEALENAKSVVDFFSGVGTFALPLAMTKRISAFELSPKMLEVLELASRKTPNLKMIKTSQRNLFKNPVLSEELLDIDGAVVNPPRAGSNAQCKELASSKIETIILVSCNPWTFAKDSQLLVKGSYNLDWVRVIDQFRWSHHIEVVAKFSRKI